jgi:hypothetical protein
MTTFARLSRLYAPQSLTHSKERLRVDHVHQVRERMLDPLITSGSGKNLEVRKFIRSYKATLICNRRLLVFSSFWNRTASSGTARELGSTTSCRLATES